MGAVTAVLVAVTWWFVVSGRSLLSPIDGRSANRWLYRSPPMRLFDFTLGILAARLFVAARGRDLSRVGAWLALVGSVVFVTLMMQAWFLDTAFSNDVAYVLPGLFIIGGLAVAPASAGARALSTRPVVLLGEVSFAMYLVHAQVIHVMGPYSWGMTYGGRWTFLAVMLVVSVAVAWVLHRLVEIPGQRVLRRLSWRRTAAPTVAAVDALATSG